MKTLKHVIISMAVAMMFASFPTDTQARIRATTTIRKTFNPSLPFSQWSPVFRQFGGSDPISSDIDASKCDAFMSAFMAADYFISAVGSFANQSYASGAYATAQGISETYSFIRLIEDKTDYQIATIDLDLSEFEEIRIEFDLNTNDGDPIGIIAANLPTLTATGNRQIPHPAFIRLQENFIENDDNATIETYRKKQYVKITKAELSPGVYIVSFKGKERDCHTCLGVIHSVVLNITAKQQYEEDKQCVRFTKKSMQRLSGELDEKYELLDRLEADLRQFLETSGINANVESLKQCGRLCDRANPPRPHPVPRNPEQEMENVRADLANGNCFEECGRNYIGCPGFVGVEDSRDCETLQQYVDDIFQAHCDINTLKYQIEKLWLTCHHKARN